MTGAQVVVRIVGVVPVDVELVVVPVHVRDIAIGVARALFFTTFHPYTRRRYFSGSRPSTEAWQCAPVFKPAKNLVSSFQECSLANRYPQRTDFVAVFSISRNSRQKEEEPENL